MTRLAVRLRPDADAPSQAWLEQRLALFRRYCAPSVDAQTCSSFIWVLYVDESIPDWFTEAVESSVEHSHRLVRLQESWSEHQFRELAELTVGSQWLLTSRLDSDDALGVRYVDLIQRSV